jgi:hypothetical protein
MENNSKINQYINTIKRLLLSKGITEEELGFTLITLNNIIYKSMAKDLVNNLSDEQYQTFTKFLETNPQTNQVQEFFNLDKNLVEDYIEKKLEEYCTNLSNNVESLNLDN